MDVDTIKLMLFILYLTVLVAGGLIWFRVVHTPSGDAYRKALLQGGYMTEGAAVDDDDPTLAHP